MEYKWHAITTTTTTTTTAITANSWSSCCSPALIWCRQKTPATRQSNGLPSSPLLLSNPQILLVIRWETISRIVPTAEANLSVFTMADEEDPPPKTVSSFSPPPPQQNQNDNVSNVSINMNLNNNNHRNSTIANSQERFVFFPRRVFVFNHFLTF